MIPIAANTQKQSANNISTIKAFNADIDNVILAKDSSENELGYIVTVTDNEAYDGSLQMTVGVKKDGTVTGISFLSLSETPGLGMKAKVLQ
jgi:electron transport complex protein RnfG